MSFAIKAENLGKSYLIGHQKKEPYSTLRDSLAHGVRNVWNRVIHPNLASSGSEIEEFWALQDVSFEIQPGDRVGIIGRNGAGKSTLPKILSRITEPTTGRFVTRGRVASLLEVGTGFHPELTGRENIYLNGAILGMTRADVKRQFDAIVDFSGVEKFLDTPVKRYSSGMYVRLAFSVAAHLEPDILIVDEVLAVGDAEFQKKCLGKMEEVGKEGRTVVFVSHNMGAVRRLCQTGFLLNGGHIKRIGAIADAIQEYQNLSPTNATPPPEIMSTCGRITLTRPYWIDANGRRTTSVPYGSIFSLRFDSLIQGPIKSLVYGVALEDYSGNRIFTAHSIDDHMFQLLEINGQHRIECQINLPYLAPGHYTAYYGIRNEHNFNILNNGDTLELIIESSRQIDGASGHLWYCGKWSKSLID